MRISNVKALIEEQIQLFNVQLKEIHTALDDWITLTVKIENEGIAEVCERLKHAIKEKRVEEDFSIVNLKEVLVDIVTFI